MNNERSDDPYEGCGDWTPCKYCRRRIGNKPTGDLKPEWGGLIPPGEDDDGRPRPRVIRMEELG